MTRAGAAAAAALFLPAALLLAACSFDYGDRNGAGRPRIPDVVMEDVQHVRVRSSEIQTRFSAERAERFEGIGIMELHNFSFEQFERGDVSASGWAGGASVELDSMDVFMDGGVRVELEAEEIAVETQALEWRDSQRLLLGGAGEEARIIRDDGTDIVGIGFRADARRREWEFSGPVAGVYVSESGNGADGGEEASE